MQSSSDSSPIAPTNPGVQPAIGCRSVATPIILGLVAIMVGFGVFYWKVDDFKQAYASSSWPTVQGRIIHSEMVRIRRPGETVSDADITYSYMVNGRQYSGYLVSIPEYQGDARSMSKIVKRYPEGNTVTVYYDPDNPANAVLEPGLNMVLLAFGGFLVLLTTVGILVVSGSLRQLLGSRSLG